jgi:hypothetical protein
MWLIDTSYRFNYNILYHKKQKVKGDNMKITKIGSTKIVMSNPESKHNYFAWPTAARLQNGKIAVVASGFRLSHICPFGKSVIVYSDDEGTSYTQPAPIIDTVLDDRDGGILSFGESSVIVTSFNNAVDFQRKIPNVSAYSLSYLDSVTPEEEAAAIGSNFRISDNFGVTFGEIHKSPVTSPHGPVELSDGTLLWVGRTFNPMNAHRPGVDCIQAHKINPDGSMEFVGEIENISIAGKEPLLCEPHAIVLDDGRILVHIRAHNYDRGIFTILQSESSDNGKSWTKPKQLLSNAGGAPPHLFKHSTGMLICTYGYRAKAPFGIRAMFSNDNGKTWDTGYSIYDNEISVDLGYPSTVELADGSLLTVFYAIPKVGEAAVIMQQKWRFENEI